VSAAFWASLFALRDGVDQQTLTVVRRLAELRRASEPETPIGGVVLARLHLDVRQELEAWSTLALAPASEPFGAQADSGRCLRLVAFWVNERVCSRLDPDDQSDFSPVGPADVELSAGGLLFFDELGALEAELLRITSPSPRYSALQLTEQLALFLLEQGFCGFHQGSVARLEPIKARLRRWPLPVPPGLPGRPTLESRPNVGYLALLAAFVLGFYACCAWASSGWGSG